MTGLAWPLRALIGPAIWAAGFSVTYALHGWGCARGWPEVATPVGDLHASALVAAFLVTLALAGAAFAAVPRGRGIERTIVLAGGWLGLAGTALTLFPVLGLTTCG